MQGKKFNYEIPTIPLLTIHMDNESPRGIDAIFQREAMLAAFKGHFVKRKSFSIKRSSDLYNVDAAISAIKELLDELYPAGDYNITENVTTNQLLVIKYSYGANEHESYAEVAEDAADYVELMIGFRKDDGTKNFYINASGYPEKIEFIAEKLPGMLEEKEVRSYDIDVIKVIDEKGDYSSKKLVIPFEKLDVPHIDFYPALKKLGFNTIEEFEEAYMSSNKPLVMFIGPPGGGKTTIMSYLALRAKQRNRFMIQHDMPLMSPGFGPWILGLGTDTLVGIEDSDSKIMMERTRDNSQMSAILNFCDGLGSYNNKLMISTNLESLRTVDKALLRVGRLWKAIELGKLTPDEANAARAAINLPAYEFTENVSLAEAISVEDMNNCHGIDSNRHPVGFAPA